MGTNYYYKLNVCPHCLRPEKTLHLGKNSYGWNFLLQANDDYYKRSWYVMKDWLLHTDGIIENEYGEIIHKHKFIELVEDNQKYKPHKDPYIVKDEEGYEFCLVDFS